MKTKRSSISVLTIVQLILVVFVVPLLPILIAWRWGWWEAWVVGLTFLFGFIISRALASQKHPGILSERSKSFGHKDAKSWDKFLAPSMAFGGVIILIIIGLEERLNWTPEPYQLPVKIASIIIFVSAYIFSSWAMVENAFFSGVVRLQKDRGHTVCDSGPYQYIRHPGYAAAFWSYLVMPLIFDSAWAFIPVFLLFIVVIVRTSLEDRTLQEELPGYRDYVSRVKYRLFTGIW